MSFQHACCACFARCTLQAAHEAGALVCLDNSILTCIYQRALDLGADIAMTSGELRAGLPCPVLG